jgi:hypothetical protein
MDRKKGRSRAGSRIVGLRAAVVIRIARRAGRPVRREFRLPVCQSPTAAVPRRPNRGPIARRVVDTVADRMADDRRVADARKVVDVDALRSGSRGLGFTRRPQRRSPSH